MLEPVSDKGVIAGLAHLAGDVGDTALRRQIRAVAGDQAQVTDASLLVVLCADLKAWQKEPSRYWRHAPKPVQDILVPAITPYYQGSEQTLRDEAMRSCGIAGQTLMIAVGKGTKEAWPKPGQLSYEEVVIRDRF